MPSFTVILPKTTHDQRARPGENMTTVSLNLLRPGERGKITHIAGGQVNVRRRLLEMGLFKGALVEFIRVAPMGDPIEIRIGEARLSLRRSEAQAITVQKEAS